MTPQPPVDPAAWVDVVRVDPDSDRPYQRLRARISHDHDVIDRERVGHATASAAEVLRDLGCPTRVLVQVLGGPGHGVREVAADEVAALGVPLRTRDPDLSPRPPQQRPRRR